MEDEGKEWKRDKEKKGIRQYTYKTTEGTGLEERDLIPRRRLCGHNCAGKTAVKLAEK